LNRHLKRGRPTEELPVVNLPLRPTTPPGNHSSEPSLITKSPHSKRTIKKGKLDGDIHPVPPPTHQYHTNEHSQTSDPSPEPSTTTKPTTSLPEASNEARAFLERLTAQLDSALRTIDTLLVNHSDLAHLDTSRTTLTRAFPRYGTVHTHTAHST
jgi:hypothetical protein